MFKFLCLILFSFLNLFKIWVQSSHNASGYFTIYGDDSLHNDHFNVRLITGDSSQTYARTGYLGFLRRTECVQADGGKLPFGTQS